jgi:acetyl-CoA synthetase (ADP-forming)
MGGDIMRRKMLQIIEEARADGRSVLFEHESKRVCELAGLPVTTFRVAETIEEIVEASKKIGYPVVLKVISRDITHKTEAGGVLLNLLDRDQVENGFWQVKTNVQKYDPKARIDGFLVQEMVPPSTEVVIGMTKDATFGPALMFGLGGIFVEILEDITFRIAPLSLSDAYEMIQEIKAYKILTGVRGRDPADIDALVDILRKVSDLVIDVPEISQLDLNPVIVYPKGAKIVDARMILEDAE